MLNYQYIIYSRINLLMENAPLFKKEWCILNQTTALQKEKQAQYTKDLATR